MPPSSPQLSVVIPVYNERESLAALVAELTGVLAPSPWTYELVLVDDGSDDGSVEVLRQLAQSNPQLIPVCLEVNRGQSSALATGFETARGGIVVTLDGDLQNDPADIPRVVEALEGADLVSGIRAERHDSWQRRFASRVANRVRNAVVHDGVTDVGCSLKAYRAQFLVGIPVFDGMHRFLPALVKANGARVREIPVNHRARRFGVSKYTIGSRMWRGLGDLYGVWWLQRRWIGQKPTQGEIP